VTERGVTLAEFEEYLRTVNNRDGRPYQEMTINAYVSPARNPDAWLTARGIDEDFTACDTTMLNRYFREYYLEHGQGGTHTLQRNLIQLFSFLARERDHPTPYADGLNRYAEVKGRPKTLGAEFVDDLLEVTGGGKARDFPAGRDHAIIRILRGEGIRRAELLGMVMHSLPADVIKNPLIRLVPVKGHEPRGREGLSSWPRQALARWPCTCGRAAATSRRIRTGSGSEPVTGAGCRRPACG
jgi:site-specific recombinase XerC